MKKQHLNSLRLVHLFFPLASLTVSQVAVADINLVQCHLEESIIGNYNKQKSPQASFEGSVSLQPQENYGEVGFINLIQPDSSGIKGQFKMFDRLIVTLARSRNIFSIAGVNVGEGSDLPQVVAPTSPDRDAQLSVTTRKNGVLTNFWATCRVKKNDPTLESDDLDAESISAEDISTEMDRNHGSGKVKGEKSFKKSPAKTEAKPKAKEGSFASSKPSTKLKHKKDLIHSKDSSSKTDSGSGVKGSSTKTSTSSKTPSKTTPTKGAQSSEKSLSVHTTSPSSQKPNEVKKRVKLPANPGSDLEAKSKPSTSKDIEVVE